MLSPLELFAKVDDYVSDSTDVGRICEDPMIGGRH